MGYYTDFKLTTKPAAEISLDLLETITNYSWESYGGGEYTPGDSIKWYEWTENMKELSLVFPDTLFILEGEGEESGDLWKAYFKNGKSQEIRAEVVFEEFDPEKMG